MELLEGDMPICVLYFQVFLMNFVNISMEILLGKQEKQTSLNGHKGFGIFSPN